MLLSRKETTIKKLVVLYGDDDDDDGWIFELKKIETLEKKIFFLQKSNQPTLNSCLFFSLEIKYFCNKTTKKSTYLRVTQKRTTLSPDNNPANVSNLFSPKNIQFFVVCFFVSSFYFVVVETKILLFFLIKYLFNILNLIIPWHS